MTDQETRTETELLAEIAAGVKTIRVIVQWAFVLAVAAGLYALATALDGQS